MFNEKILTYKDETNGLVLIDINTCKIVDKIILETSYFHIFKNKFDKLIVGLLYEYDCWYQEYYKEYTYEYGELIRGKTLEDICLNCMAEGGDNFIWNGHVYVFK